MELLSPPKHTPGRAPRSDRPAIHIQVAARDLHIASVRYRGLLPGCALRSAGWRVRVGSKQEVPCVGTRLALAVKPLSARDGAWVSRVTGLGMPVVADICDNIFIDGYAMQGRLIGDRFAALSQRLAAVTVPTTALRDVVLAETGLPSGRVLVVPDIIETPALLARQRRLLDAGGGWGARLRGWWSRRQAPMQPSGRPALLWYGNHGAPYADYGLHDLLRFEAALRLAAERFGAELWVVSNNQERYAALAPRLPIPSRYFEWRPDIVDVLLPLASICLVPNSLDPFSRTKSANRTVKALGHGVPVIATPTAAHADLAGAVWLGDPTLGIEAFLVDSSVRRAHLRAAATILGEHYSLAALARAMTGVVAVATEAAP